MRNYAAEIETERQAELNAKEATQRWMALKEEKMMKKERKGRKEQSKAIAWLLKINKRVMGLVWEPPERRWLAGAG
jgi:hypothetical protein